MNVRVHPFLREEEDGAWLPMHVFPSPWRRFDFDIVRNVMQNPDISLDIKLGRGAQRGVNITGFGRKYGEYLRITNDHCVRCIGSSLEEERKKLSTATTTSTATTATEIMTRMIKMEREEEVLALVDEEFPLLTQYCKDCLEIMGQIDGRRS